MTSALTSASSSISTSVVTSSRTATVAIFGTSGYEADPTRLDRTRAYFQSKGLEVVSHLRAGRHERFAGVDAERLRSLQDTIADPIVDIAIAQRGGYGVTRLLPAIAFDAMATAVERGVRFVGHSDFTALSLGLLARTGAVSFAGPMASFGFGRETVDAFTEEHFWRAMRTSCVDVAFDTPYAVPLSIEGRLWGGNLSMIASLIGTPWMPVVDDGILFIEDVNEQPYRIERMLLQLQQAGVLDRQRAILCGDFTGYRVADYDNGYDLEAALARVQQDTSAPLIRGLPFGHVPRKLTLAVGAPASIEITNGTCRLRQAW